VNRKTQLFHPELGRAQRFRHALKRYRKGREPAPAEAASCRRGNAKGERMRFNPGDKDTNNKEGDPQAAF
jgi:hypothetical protein